MSIEVDRTNLDDNAGFPELSPLGKRIEMLRIVRGLSKQQLARRAGTSRQQLWRVVTGKSELTTSLCARLAEALNADPRELRAAHGSSRNMRLYPALPVDDPAIRGSLEQYWRTPDALQTTLRSLPDGPAGRLLAGALRTAIEELATRLALPVPGDIAALFDAHER
jgi:transcriptional regulator with XRE-family HTH domain